VRAAKAALRAAEDAEEAASNALRAALGNASVATVDGVKAATWKAQERTALDIKRLATDNPELAEKYRTVSTFRVLRTTKETS